MQPIFGPRVANWIANAYVKLCWKCYTIHYYCLFSWSKLNYGLNSSWHSTLTVLQNSLGCWIFINWTFNFGVLPDVASLCEFSCELLACILLYPEIANQFYKNTCLHTSDTRKNSIEFMWTLARINLQRLPAIQIDWNLDLFTF